MLTFGHLRPLTTDSLTGTAGSHTPRQVYATNTSSKKFIHKVFGAEVSSSKVFVEAVDRWVRISKNEDLLPPFGLALQTVCPQHGLPHIQNK
jgi:hypothetical protein